VDKLPIALIPASQTNLCISDGEGNPISYTAINGSNSNPIFENGIIFNNRANAGIAALKNQSEDNSQNGKNPIIATYDVKVKNDSDLTNELTNTASIMKYANIQGGQISIHKATKTKQTLLLITQF
jgi:hypothetical protein